MRRERYHNRRTSSVIMSLSQAKFSLYHTSSFSSFHVQHRSSFRERVSVEDCFSTQDNPILGIVVYYESMKREVKTRPIYECPCDGRLQTKVEESTRLVYTGLLGELEHLKIDRDEVNRRDVCECDG